MAATAKAAANDTVKIRTEPLHWGWYLLALLLPALTALGIGLGGWWTFMPLAWSFIAVPLLDWRGGNRFFKPRTGPSTTQRHAAIVWLALPVQLALYVWALWVISAWQLGVVEWIGMILSVGLTGGSFGITCAHELVHRPRAWERGLGVALLAMVSDMTFRIEHVYGHHRNVGTPKDPATARPGENVYRFVQRSMAQSVISAWRIEAARLRKRKLSVWSPRNRMLHYAVIQALVYAGIVWAFGWPALGFFLAQSYIAIGSLETTNYQEHYGLYRKETAPGKHEPVGPQHSWNAGYVSTDTGLFSLGRHSDHHVRAGRPFADLGNDPEAPQLPAGYATVYLMMLVPPLWRRVMDPRVEAWRAKYG